MSHPKPGTQLRSLWGRVLATGLLAATLAACGGLPPDCRIDDLDDQQMSTRVIFLERLNGCNFGGR